MLIRLGLSAIVLALTVAIERRIDRTAAEHRPHISVVPMGSSSALVARWSDSLLIVARDSLTLERARSSLRRVIERHDPGRVATAELVDDSSNRLRWTSQGVAFVRGLPLAILRYARSPVRAARIDGVPIVVISLDQRLDRALELTLDVNVDNWWRQHSWR